MWSYVFLWYYSNCIYIVISVSFVFSMLFWLKASVQKQKTLFCWSPVTCIIQLIYFFSNDFILGLLLIWGLLCFCFPEFWRGIISLIVWDPSSFLNVYNYDYNILLVLLSLSPTDFDVCVSVFISCKNIFDFLLNFFNNSLVI